MLLNIWNILSNSGVNSNLNPSISRYIILTNRFGIISGLISLSILLTLFIGIQDIGWNITRLLILISSLLFSSVVILNRAGFYNLSRWIISWLPAILIFYISITDKIFLTELITIKDFFSYRFLLMSTTIIPLLIFSTREIKILLINLLPSFIGTVFFDHFHKPFGVNFNQFGFNDPYFYILDLVVAFSYFGMVGFLLSQRFVADKFEVKMNQNQHVLQEKNMELLHMNSFINEQNHEITAQTDKLKETNDALSDAKDVIEEQKHLLQSQNRNLEQQVIEKTKDLSRVNEELIINNNEMRQFSHTLSHNLKSPVATFQGLLNLVEEDDLNATNKELLMYLNQSVSQMHMVFSDLNEMLELRNQLYTSTEEIDVQEHIDSLHSHFYPEIVRNNIDFSCNCNGTKSIETNAKRLNGILFQLISNSIKFRSEKRKPEIRLSLNGNGDYHSIKIRDNGLGINLNMYCHKLFYPYQKFHDGIAGKGLGLYLVKLQTESLGGNVKITSQPDEYTEVEVLLKK